MWMQMPNGVERVSVERQTFEKEFADAGGVGYTRVPEHFGPKLTPLGFRRVEQPTGAPDDLPRADPLRDGAIADLNRETEVLRRDVQNLRGDLVAANAELAALMVERDEWKRRAETAETKLEEIEKDE